MKLPLRPIACVLTALLLTGCSSTKQVPSEEFKAASQLPNRIYDVRTKDGSLYVARHYSVSDSTLVITELHKKDERYTSATMPIVLQLDDVASIQMRDQREAGQVLVLMAFAVVGIALVALIIDAADGGLSISD